MKKLKELWQKRIDKTPLIAILRGVQPDEVVAVGRCLLDSGFTVLEVPLNSPEPFQSIERLTQEFGDKAIIGAGTVLTSLQVKKTVNAGGKLVVAPNYSSAVAETAVKAGVLYCPGVATPTEAFNALDGGATALKIFPAELVTPAAVKAIMAVLPDTAQLFAVGGITPDNMDAFVEAGVTGFGIGSALYKPGKKLTEIEVSAIAFVKSLKS